MVVSRCQDSYGLGECQCLYDLVALYICPNYIDIGIHPDDSYLDTLEQPWRTTLIVTVVVLPELAELGSGHYLRQGGRKRRDIEFECK